jgi:hypothetical protein
MLSVEMLCLFFSLLTYPLVNLSKLGIKKEIVSLPAEQIYNRKGIKC